jgi:hypothetical protein
LADEDILSDDLLRQLMSVGETDILVGIHTHNNAKTVGRVVQAIREGLLKFFPRERVAILNVDGGSQDGTTDLVRAAAISDVRDATPFYALRTLHCISSQYDNVPTAGKAMHIVVAASDLLRVKACAIVAPESFEIQPDWMNRLVRPIYREHYDFVAPVYGRQRFEGMLVTNLMYPMTRAVYGKPIREPRPGEFAFSDRLASQLIGHELWNQDAGRLGPEVCFTVSALADDARIFQTFLGPKGHVDHQPADLVSALRQTVAPLFWSMEATYDWWNTIGVLQTLPSDGPEFEVGMDPVQVDLTRLHQMFASGVVDLQDVLKSILSASTLAQLQAAAASGENNSQYTDELWVKVVYEFAASYHRSVINRDHIIQALAPLYRGRTYAFLTENMKASKEELQTHIEALCQAFERQKPYLLELWTAQERGS